MPAGLLDLLLAANIAVAVIILLTTLAVKTPLEFSVFPSLLLATTLSRLVLNVASTRLILTAARPPSWTRQAGDSGLWRIRGGQSHGRGAGDFLDHRRHPIRGDHQRSRPHQRSRRAIHAGRHARPADGHRRRLECRLDRQREAQRRRQEILQQADFYGAMDGASKFVRGDAVAGLVITVINIVGGLFVGVVEGGMSLAAAAAVFTKLTIGDGLVAKSRRC